MAIHLVWFRNDLRVIDHSALYHACQDDEAQVIAVYIATPKQWQHHGMSPRQAWFIQQHLSQLQASLTTLNIPLLYCEESDFKAQKAALLAICQQYNVTDLFYNQQYEWYEQQRDKQLTQQLKSQQINCHSFDDAVLFQPGQILTGKGTMYQVYTPFRNRCLEYLKDKNISVYPKPAKRVLSPEIACDSLQPFSYDCQETAQFEIGEDAALVRLQQFVEEQVEDYAKTRDIPELAGTSQLSAYLAIGVISPRQCLARLTLDYPEFLHRPKSGAFIWFNELIWRDFYHHLLVAYPRLSKNQPFIQWTDHIQWQKDESLCLCWQKGETGFPIVDAAMRQLNQTGWMHNRLRMIVASFLVKDLLIDWREGERYFMSQLIDGDLAANNGGWQWSASTGVDAAPYFRIFNPTTQGKRFDPKGRFIRRYLPELAQVPDKALHQPHKWAKQHQVQLDYPAPIVDHQVAREATLEAFNIAKSR